MTSWIIAIDRNHSEHWETAAEHGFWDMTRSLGIEAHDEVYFWQAGASFVGRTLVTRAVRRLGAGDTEPWEDSGDRLYSHRFEFRVLSQAILASPTWAEVKKATGIAQGPNFRPKAPSRAAEQWLASLFSTSPTPDLFYPNTMRVAVDAILGDDQRERANREIAIRRGQPAFRRALLDAYEGCCAVTGTSLPAILEAAHIAPYRGEHTNDVRNGLLLRTDMHTLFDLHLITVSDDLSLHISPELVDSPYAKYERRALARTRLPEHSPSVELLADHRAQCSWFVLGANR